jgi:hypothetical protein
MKELKVIESNLYDYNLLLASEDSYNEDAKQFVSFLKVNSLPISLDSLKEYSLYLDTEKNGIRYSANTYNKRIQGAKERIKQIFHNSIYFNA